MQQLLSYILSVFIALNPILQVNKTKTTILLTGDVMLGRSVMTQSLAKNDPTYPFQKVADKLKSADIVFVNLETPIKENCPTITNNFIFCTDKKMIEGLKFVNINIVNLANNHTLNMGREGLSETERLLSENNIKWVGDNNLEIIEKNGIKFGFLGFDFVDHKLSQTDLDLIKFSKQKVDVLVVATHWGLEYYSVPIGLQREYAQVLVGAGADVIAGTHPHWVQKVELIDNKPVFYSLGNFVFDQMWSEETRLGVVGELNYEGKRLVSLQSLPIYMKTFAQPVWEQ